MKYYILIITSIICLLSRAQSISDMQIKCLGDTIDTYLAHGIDSITYEIDFQSNITIQKTWYGDTCINYRISKIDSILFIEKPIYYTDNFNIDGSVGSVITTAGDYALTFVDSLSQGFITIFGNIDINNYLYVKLDSTAIIRTIAFDSLHYILDYYNDSVRVSNFNNISEFVQEYKISRLAMISLCDSSQIDYSWPRYCRILTNILVCDSSNLKKCPLLESIIRISNSREYVGISDSNMKMHLSKVKSADYNRTMLDDALYLADLAKDIEGLIMGSPWEKIAAGISLLHKMDEVYQRWNRFTYLGWLDLLTMPAESIKTTSATLPCKITGYNPEIFSSNYECTMTIRDSDHRDIDEKRSDVSGPCELSFNFENLTPQTQYYYQPHLFAYYYQIVGGADCAVGDVLSGNCRVVPVQTVWTQTAQIAGVEMSFITNADTIPDLSGLWHFHFPHLSKADHTSSLVKISNTHYKGDIDWNGWGWYVDVYVSSNKSVSVGLSSRGEYDWMSGTFNEGYTSASGTLINKGIDWGDWSMAR